MKLLPYFMLNRHKKGAKIFGFILLLVLLPLLLAVLAPHQATKNTKHVTYYASELTMRSKKTLFKPTEKPTFKVGIGKLSTQKTSMLQQVLASFGLAQTAFADDTPLPELIITANRTIRDTDTVPMITKRSGSDEVEIQVEDIRAFRPGKYTMSIVSGTRKIEQDFTWGVLAVNTNKSVYSPGETANIGFAVLDDIGRTKCVTGTHWNLNKGEVTIEITDPHGNTVTKSTHDKTITGSNDCEEHSVTNNADFQTSYKTSVPGIYQMHVVGENQNGKKSIDDYFEVRENQDVIIERTSLPTRIFPASEYTNTISIYTKSAFKGQIIEKTPASFHITCDGCVVKGDDIPNNPQEPATQKASHTIIWNVDWQAGGAHQLSYTFDPPRNSPEFYLLGPIQVQNDTHIIFEEVRPWQIASDATITWNGNGATNNWSTTGNWSTGTAPTTTSNVVLDGVASPNGNKNGTINNATVGSVTDITSNGYSGTVTQAAAVATSGTAGITFTTGTFTGATQAITLTDGSLTVNGGTFTTTTGAVSIQRNLTYSSGTLTNNASGINFTDNTNVDDSTLSCGATLSGTWRINKTTGGDFTLGSGCTVSMSENVTSSVGSLINHGSLTITGASTIIILTDTSATNDGTLTVDNSGALLRIERNLDNTGGTLTNNGIIEFTDSTNADDSTLTCGNTPGGTFRVNKTVGGDFTLSSGCTVSVSENVTSSIGAFTNHGTMTVTGASTVLIFTDSSITSDGSLTLDNSGATMQIERNLDSTGGTLTNNGTIDFTDSSNADDSTLTCSGTPGGTFRINKDVGGDFILSSGCTISATHSVTTTSFGLFTNHGTLTWSSGTLTMADSTLTNDGTLINNDTINFQRTFNNNGGTLTNTSGTIIASDNSAADAAAFTCENSIGGTFSVTKTSSSTFTINNGGSTCTTTLTFSSAITGTFTNHGTTTLSSGTVTVRDTNLVNDGTLTNSGATVNAERNFDNTGGTLSNSGTIAFVDTSAADASTFTCSNTINGTVNLSKTLSSTFSLSSGCTVTNAVATGSNVHAAFTIDGSLHLTSGTLLVRDATLTVGSAGVFTIDSGVVINAERNWTESSGSITTNSGTINFVDTSSADTNTWTCGTASNLGDVVVNKTVSGTVTLSGNCTVEDFTRTTGAFNNPGAASILSVQGNFSMSATATFGGSNLTITMTGGATQTIAQNAGTFSPAFKVNKSGGSASLTTAFTVATLACTVEEGTFDINGQSFTCGSTFTIETGGNLQLVGTETPTSPTLNSGSTVTYKGDGDAGADTITLKSWVYHHLTINSTDGATDTFQPPAALTGANDINGNLTITAGTFDVISGTNYGVDVVGNFSNAGTFLAQAGTLKVGTNFTNTGTFTAGTGTVEFNTSSTTVVNGTDVPPVVTFNNLTIATNDKIVNFTAGKTFRVNGVLTVTGTLGHEVIINSTTSSQWFINHQGTESVTYATITNSGCDGTSTDIDLTGGTNNNGGNNGGCWVFTAGTITVSGNIYTDEGSTAYDCSGNTITVHVSVNGGANNDANCTLNTGAFSVSTPTPAANDIIVIFIDSAESIKATTVTIAANSSNISSLKLYTDHVVLSHESAGPITNANLATADNADAGIRYSVSGGNLTTDSGMELYVYNSKTYTPGGSVTTQGTGGDFQLGNSATATLGTATNAVAQDIVINTSASLTINADTTVDGGDISATGTLTTSSGTPTITVRGTGSISGSGTKTVYNLIIGDGTTATTTLSGTVTANNDVTVGTGSTLHQNASLTVSGGDFTTTTTGVVDTTSGTGTVTISGTGNIGAGSGGTFGVYNLTVSGTQTLVSDITTSNDIAVTTGASLELAGFNVGISGGDMTTAGTGTITCASCSSGTVSISGTGTIGGGGAITVYNLSISGTQTLASTTTVSNDIAVTTSGTLDIGSQNLTVNGGDFTTTGAGVIRCNSCSGGTVTMSGTGTLGSGNGNITFYNLATSGTGTTTFSGAGTNTVSNNVTVGAGTTLAINSTTTITGSLTNTTTGVITTSTGTPTVTVSGSSIGGGSGSLTFYNLTKSGAGTTTFSGSGTNTVNNNLSISNGTFTQSDNLTVTNDVSISTGATHNVNADLNINGGDFTTAGTGVINTTSGTPTVTISGTGTLGSGNGNITFYNLVTTGTGTTTFSGAGTNTVNNNVSVGTGTTLNINSSVSITGNLTTTTTGIINTTSGTPTVTVSGTVIGGGSGDITIYNLTKATSSTAIFSGSGTNTISNNLAVSAGTLTVSNNVSIGNDVSVATSSTLNLNGDTSVSGGDATTTGTGIISTTNGTPTLTISGTGTVGGGGAVTTYNLTISGTQTISSATNVANALTVNGTMSGSSTVTVNGAFTGTGTVSHAGTVEQRVGANANFGTTSGTNAWSFATLIFSNSTAGSNTVTTQTGGSGGITVSTLLQVGKGTDATTTVLDAGNRTWTLSGTSGTPFTIPQGSVTANTSTFTYTGNNSGGNTLLADTTYYSLIVNNSSETWNLANSLLTINNGLTVTAGTLDLQTNSLSVGSSSVSNSGGISVAGTLTQSAGGTTTVKTSAAGAATVGGAGTLTFYSLTIAPTAASGTITLGSAASQTITVNNNLTIGDGSNTVSVTASANNPILDVNGNFTINASGTFVAPPSANFTIAGNMTNNGTFTHSSGTVTLDTTTTATLAGSGSPAITFNSLTIATSDKTVLFTSGETFRTNGVLTVTGTSGHPVTIDATTDTSQWYINHQGTESLAYAAVQDSGCDVTSTNISLSTSSTNNGNNGTCWIFTMDVSGNIYTDEGSTAYNCSVDNLTVHLSVNGGANENATCTQSSGAFTFTNVPQPSSGTPFVVFIDTGETPKATTVSLTGSGAISSFKLYQNYVIVSHENAGPITNANLATADNADAGIRYAVSSGNLTTDSGMTLFVYDGKTYTPGGTVTTNTTGGNFKLGTSSTATLGTATNAIGADITVGSSATLTINADTTVSGGDITTTGTLTTSSGTPTVTVRGTGTIGSSGSSTFYNLAIGDGTTASSTLGSTITVNNDISVGNGSSLALNNKDVTISGGDMTTTGTGTITCTACSAGTVTISGTGNIGGGGTVTTYNLTSSSGTQTLSSATTALNNVTANGTLTGSSNLTLSGAFAGTGTVSLTGTTEQRVAANQNFGTTSGTNAWSFATLIFSNSSGTSKTITTQTGGSGGITASTLLQIGKGGDSASTVLDAGNRTWTLSGTSGTPFTIPQGSLTANTSTFSYTGNNGGGNTTLANTTYYSLSVNNGSETYNAAASPLTVNNALTVSAGTLDLQTNSLSVGSTSVTNSGSIANSGTITQSSSGTTTVKTSASGTASIGGSGTTTFYNLTVAPTAASGIITLGNGSSQTITVSNDLTIGDGSNAVTVTASTYSPTLDINGSFSISASGTFTAPASSSFTIAKNMTNNGTFTANAGTVTFDTTNTSTLAGSGSPAITFYNLSSSTSTKSLLFTAGETFRTDGLISFTNISIDSTTSSQWFINHQGSESIGSGTSITNSGCDGSSTPINAVNATNGGNNGTCWIFAGGITPAALKGPIRLGGNTRFQ